MTKREAIDLIDGHKNALLDPVEMLRWTWLRVVVNQIPDNAWEAYLEGAAVVLSR